MLLVLTVLVVFLVFQVFFWPWKVPLLNVLDAVISIVIILIVVVVSTLSLGAAGGNDVNTVSSTLLLVLIGFLYGSCGLMMLMTLSALFFRDQMGGVGDIFLLKRAPDTEALAYLFRECAASAVVALPEDTFEQMLSDLPVYDLWLMERIVHVILNCGAVMGTGRLSWSTLNSARISHNQAAAERRQTAAPGVLLGHAASEASIDPKGGSMRALASDASEGAVDVEV